MRTLARWRFAIVLVLLCLFVFLFAVDGHDWLWPRKAALGPHVSTATTFWWHKVVVGLAILVLTAVFGRWYCSLLCPAGLVQEVFSRLGKRLGLSRVRHRPGTLAGTARPVLMLLFVVGFACIGNLAPLDNMDPIGLFGRLAVATGDAAASAQSGRWEYDALYLLVFAIAAIMLVVTPLFLGRWFCATLCPVSGLFHLFGKPPGKRIIIDREKCVSCGKCGSVCPVGCADPVGKSVDDQRCVLCLECAAACPVDAIAYGRPDSVHRNRRVFLDAAAAAAATAAFVSARSIGPALGLPIRDPLVVPPGSGGDTRHRSRCVTCQACVRACPVGIIRPQGDARRPGLDFSRGYCQYNCTACASSCPAGVFEPIALQDKHRTRIATTHLVLPNCVVITKHQECGACAEVCPTHAVIMKARGPGQPTIPDFDPDYCIGCGACYHVCPAAPRAFSVTGLAVHERSQGVRIVSSGEATPALPPPDAGGLTEFPF
ncbi:MAG: 4Fe-4S dicluster domain-containing protein [Planctomycetaceae bacterium]|nr:4Fe-4S dicluster domain-containing protein [Planctomycetaceae bacterium]